MEQDVTMEQRHRMEHNGTGSFGHFWFLHFWLNKKLASRVKNTENESAHVRYQTEQNLAQVELTQQERWGYTGNESMWNYGNTEQWGHRESIREQVEQYKLA